MNLKRSVWTIVRKLLFQFGYELKRTSSKTYLHNYTSYEEYRHIQIHHNKRKIRNVWADPNTLDKVAERVRQEFASANNLFALCHGTRNGFEQRYLAKKLNATIIGTDISDTADQFENTVQWDFHDQKSDWICRCDFIYSNSLDQSFAPKEALTTWISQLRVGGLLFLEHTDDHGPSSAGEMDPFGAEPTFMPYLLTEWFGHKISLDLIQTKKSNLGIHVWLYVIKRITL